MESPILVALRQLDPLNDDHWTGNGDPRIDAVKALVVGDTQVDRQSIVNVAPDFNREKAGQPESLLMNKDEDDGLQDPVLVDSNPDFDHVEVDQPDDYLQDLLMTSEGVSFDLLGKLMHQPGGLQDQELFLLTKSFSTDQLESFSLGLEQQMAKLLKHQEVVKSTIDQLRRNSAMVKNTLTVIKPEKSNQSAISDYIAAQNRARAEAATNRRIVLQGLKANEVSPVAPIDQAMARKDNRGKQRPSYPGSK